MTSASIDELPVVHLFTDGACSGNPGPGGWAYILRDPETGREKEMTGGDRETTNNRMEMLAVIEALRSLKRRSRVELWSDSQYVINGLREWMDGWKKKGWKRSGKQPVLNLDLWQELDRLRDEHDIHCHWVRGHNDHLENERVDRLAVAEIENHR